MPTTFGELTALAHDHLRAAAKADLATASAAEVVAVTCALAAVTARAGDLIAEPPHRPRNTDPDPAWRLAGATVTEQVTRARELLALTAAGLVPERTAFRHRAAAHLLAGRAALGASRDLLATHTDLTSGGPVDRTPEAALLRTAAARHQLVATAAGYAERLAPLAAVLAHRFTATDPPRSASLRTVAGHLATAAAATRFVRDPDIGERTLTSGVELVEPMHRRTPPQAGETPGELLNEALKSARRLRLAAFRDLSSDVPDHHSGSTLAIVALAMVTSHALELRLADALRIAQPAADVGAPDLLEQLDNVIALTKAGATAWSQVHRQWAGVQGLPSAENDIGVRADAADLVHRLDALADRLYRSQTGEDPLSPRTSSPVDSVAVDPLRLARDLRSLQEVQRQLAIDHARLSATLGSAKRLFIPTRALNDAFDVPRRCSPAPPQCLSALADAYGEAGSSMRGEDTQRGRDAGYRQPSRHRDRAAIGLDLPTAL